MLIRLPKNAGFKIEGDCRGILIRCEEGILWITQTGDPDDHFIVKLHNFQPTAGYSRDDATNATQS